MPKELLTDRARPFAVTVRVVRIQVSGRAVNPSKKTMEP